MKSLSFRLLKKTVVLSAVFASLAGASAFAQDTAPGPSAEEIRSEAILKAALADRDQGLKLKYDYFESVLNIYYKMFALQEEFYQDTLATIEKQKQEPTYEHPLDRISSYMMLRASWPLSEELEQRITYLFGRLNEIAHDSKAAEKDQAVEILGDIHKWIADRDDADRLMLASLLHELSEIEHKYQTGDNHAPGARSVASIDNFDYNKSTFGGLPDLSHEFTKHDAELQKRATSALHKKDAAFDAAVASASVMSDDRQPSSATEFKASTGPEGNFTGLSLPKGTFVQTFDDGPNPTLTDKLIDLATGFKDSANPKGVPLTFFWLEKNAGNTTQIARAKSLGFLVNNHSWTHPVFHKLTPDQLHHEIADAEVALTKAFGKQPASGTDKIQYFRCPYGDCIYANHNKGVPAARELIAAQNEIHILWNIDSNDWAAINRMNPARTAQLTITQMKAMRRGVILNHDIQPHTPDAFTLVLNWVKAQNDQDHAGIRYVSVKDAIAMSNSAAVKK